MPVEDLLFEIFSEAGRELFLVGGTVRDRLLGLASSDLDFATDSPPDSTVSILESRGIRTFDTGRRFGTITAVVQTPGGVVRAEITTYRSEHYEKGSRKPRVRFGRSLESDLSRRDFTINAIAMDSRGAIIDPAGGAADLASGVIRTPGDPVSAMADDPLRILRAVRFRGRFGFRIDAALEAAIRAGAGSLREVSVERWLRELDGMLLIPSGAGASSCMRGLVDLDVLPVVLPEIVPLAGSDAEDPGVHHVEGVWSHTLSVMERTRPGIELRWAALFHDAGKPFRRSVDPDGSVHFHGHPEVGAELALQAGCRLRFPKARRLAVSTLVRLHQRPAEYRADWGDAAVRRLSRDAGDLLCDLLALSEADSACRAPESAARRTALLAGLRRRLETDPLAGRGRLVPCGVGERLTEMLGPGNGPLVGRLVGVLEEMVLNGRLTPGSTTEEFLAALEASGLLPGAPGKELQGDAGGRT
ncbi:MAG TPA: HD domain-containing protein [Candidatus Fermentibacter daniensis]|nr:HD domain-containing protein [Candidatus Fermentibacter daniensis]